MKANCIVPSATINELLKLINSNLEFVSIYLSESHIILHSAQLRYIHD